MSYFKIGIQYFDIIGMRRCFDHEINLLCVGDVLCGKSSFLQNYAECFPQTIHYKVYPKMNKHGSPVFFHQVEERYGMDAYFSYPFDGVLYFLNINDYHNPQFSIIEQLAQISKLNGSNIFKIPLKIMVLSSKHLPYSSIRQSEKENLQNQLIGMVQNSMIIFIEDDQSYLKQLQLFFEDINGGEAPGIAESFYVRWYLKGIQDLLTPDYLILSWKKMTESIKRQWKNFRFSSFFGKTAQTIKDH